MRKINRRVTPISKAEVKSTIELAKIFARLEMKRLDLGMTQKELADYMGASQGMVSKWEREG